MDLFDTKTIKDANNIAVGKLIEVELVHNERTLRLPIAIRLNTKTIDTQSLLHILGIVKIINLLKKDIMVKSAGEFLERYSSL